MRPFRLHRGGGHVKMCDMHRFSSFATATLVLSYIGFGTVTTIGRTPPAQAKTPAPKNATSQFPSTPKSIAAGKGVFNKYCRMCHGDDAKGNGPQAPDGTHPPNLIDEKWEHGSTDAEIFANIKNGVGPKFDMKGFNSKLTTQEMWSVLHYVRSIGPQGVTR